jgi:ceramide glucosyltransferase
VPTDSLLSGSLWSAPPFHVILLLYVLCGAAGAYQLVALAAVVWHMVRRERTPATTPAVSILKPVHGRDPFFEQAIASHMNIDYPRFEVLFGVNRADDEAVPAIQQFGGRLYVSAEDRPNAKVANLIELARHATGAIWVVNDGDIRVTPDYLRRVVAPLDDAEVGVVTCLYRPIPQGLSAAWEALGIAIDFAPSTLVAPLVGINEFGLGSTLCFRSSDLREAGGFETIADYLADDYQLAKRLTRGLGKRSVMSKLVVDTSLGYRSWREMWRHQVRWARTIRVSRAEYLGLPVTHAGVWALVAMISGLPLAALALVCARIAMGVVAGGVLLRFKGAWIIPLIPVWDLWAFAVWLAGIRGNTIEWRGKTLELRRDGKLQG